MKFNPLLIAKRGRGPNKGSEKQAAAGPQGPGGSLNLWYSARELLKALESDESWINMMLWYRLVSWSFDLLHITSKVAKILLVSTGEIKSTE